MISPKHLITRWLAAIRMTTNQREIMATLAKSAALKLCRQETAPRKAVVERIECEDVRRHTLLISFDYRSGSFRLALPLRAVGIFMTPETFIANLAHWTAGPPIYLISGSEPAATARCLAAARALVDPGFIDFNHHIFNLAETPVNRVVAEAGVMPFFQPPKVVVAKGAPDAEGQAQLLKYLASPNPQTILLLVLEKPDARLKIFKALKEQGSEVSCLPPKGVALNAWVKARLSEAGLTADQRAIRLLIERAGAETGLLLAEIDKLSLYALGRGSITADDVKLMTSLAPGGNIFELGDALGEGRSSEALVSLIEILRHEHYLPVLAMIIRHFRLLLKAKTWLWAGGAPSDSAGAAKSLGMPPFVAGRYLKQAQALTWAALKQALKLLENAHRHLVTQPTPPQLVMENLALNLSQLPRRRP